MENIEKYYNLKDLKITKNEDSTDGNVYNLSTEQNKYILKVYDKENYAIVMTNLMEKLNDKNFYVPKILKNIYNENYTELNGKFFVIYSFLEGKSLKQLFNNIPNDVSIKIAKELRKMHNKCANLNNIGLQEINFFENNMRKSVLHFDLTRDNIFYNEKIGFIDFDDAKYGEAIIDVSILIVNLYFSKTRGTNIEGVKYFINEYYKNDEFNKKIEVPLIKETSIKWINYILNENRLDSSTIDSFENKKALIREVEFNEFI